jgi:hypothetical protein
MLEGIPPGSKRVFKNRAEPEDGGDWLVLTGNLLFKMGSLTEEAIPQDTCDARIRGVEALSDTALGVVGQVLGVVDPVNPVI